MRLSCTSLFVVAETARIDCFAYYQTVLLVKLEHASENEGRHWDTKHCPVTLYESGSRGDLVVSESQDYGRASSIKEEEAMES